MRILAVVAISLLLVSCQKDPKQILKEAAEDAGSGDYKGAEKNYRWLLERSPDDAFLKANLAFALTRQNKHGEAIPLYEELIKDGDAAYDLFAFYAVSLQATGKNEEAIAWNYRALSIVPKLADVRHNLAKLLVKVGRPYEALSLLASFDGTLEAQGNPPFFKAQRIAIQTSLPREQNTQALADRSAKIGGHFYFSVLGQNGESAAFLIDTGASHTVMSPQTLAALGFTIPQHAKQVTLTIGDNRRINGQEFELPSLRLGPFQLKNVPVVICANAPALLGQSTLAHFDLMTQKDNGCDFLILRMRSAE